MQLKLFIVMSVLHNNKSMEGIEELNVSQDFSIAVLY